MTTVDRVQHRNVVPRETFCDLDNWAGRPNHRGFVALDKSKAVLWKQVARKDLKHKSIGRYRDARNNAIRNFSRQNECHRI